MQEILTSLKKELGHLYSDSEFKTISYLLLEKITGFSRVQILLNKNTIFSEEQKHILQTFVEKLKKNEPIQYVLGKTEFYGLTLSVNSSVLIPRPETEELVDWIRIENLTINTPRILDIGTGSGCIALALKTIFPNGVIDAYDISEKALLTAQQNASQLNLKVNFCQNNILENNELNGSWDIIVSNPPYIPQRFMNEMDANVLYHEPHLALFVSDEDPLLFYKKIISFADNNLAPGGSLFFEIHHDAGDAICNLFSLYNFDSIELRKDISGNDRMIKATKKSHA